MRPCFRYKLCTPRPLGTHALPLSLRCRRRGRRKSKVAFQLSELSLANYAEGCDCRVLLRLIAVANAVAKRTAPQPPHCDSGLGRGCLGLRLVRALAPTLILRRRLAATPVRADAQGACKVQTRRSERREASLERRAGEDRPQREQQRERHAQRRRETRHHAVRPERERRGAVEGGEAREERQQPARREARDAGALGRKVRVKVGRLLRARKGGT